jgi:hypothetical protein
MENLKDSQKPIKNKFITNLSASDSSIKETRATLLSKGASIAANALVQRIETEKLALEMEISKLTDLAPDTSYSLKPGGDKFDAATWVEQLHKTKLKLSLKEIELKSAQEIVNEWFETDAK